MSEEAATVELFNRLRETLRRSDAFDSDAALRATFGSDPRLQPWQDLVPDAANRAERVRLTVAALGERRDRTGRPALVLLLDALRDQLYPADQLYEELRALSDALSRALAPPSPRPDVVVDEDVPQPPARGRSPFKGLYYYDVSDAANFFGREALTATLLRLLPRTRSDVLAEDEEREAQFLAIVGPSGSGKTSLLRAGLLAALEEPGQHADAPPGIGHWPHFLLSPTDQPLQKLATSLTQNASSVLAAAQLIDDMKQEPRSLALYAHRLLESHEADRVLLIVDQLEELFTLCSDDEVRRLYLDNLITACTQGPVVLVTGLRSDYYDAAGRYEGLRSLLTQRQVYIGRMSEAELRRVVQEPALQNGWQFESGLVDRILTDVGHDPGTLPLLSQALHATWQHRQGYTLTHHGYREAGGVGGAIARSAESMFNSLSEEEQQSARALLLRMVVPAGESGRVRLPSDARALVPRDELMVSDGMVNTSETALNALARNHLIVEEEGLVALAHEALLREWPRLQHWLDEERQRLALHRRLTDATRHWQESGRQPDRTYRGTQLEEAEAYAARPAYPPSELERAFLAESRRVMTQEQLEIQRQVEAARRAPIGGALGGALGYGLTFWIMYRELIDLTGLLVAFAVIQTMLGGAAGAGLVWRVGTTEQEEETGAAGRWMTRPIVSGAGVGALVFGVFLLAHTILTADRNLSFAAFLFTALLAMLQGGAWGAAAGAGLVWHHQSPRPEWQTLGTTALASGTVLTLGNFIGRAFAWEGTPANPLTVFVAGAVTPLAILLGTRLASARRSATQESREQGVTLPG